MNELNGNGQMNNVDEIIKQNERKWLNKPSTHDGVIWKNERAMIVSKKMHDWDKENK